MKKIYIHNVFYYILLYIIFISISIEKQIKFNLRKLIFQSEIFLIIKGNDQPILNNKRISIYNTTLGENQYYTFESSPSEIISNGELVNSIGFYVNNLTNNENHITIKFNEPLTNCDVMFFGLSNIIYINFIKVDSSRVKSMIGMFCGCNNLTSLDLNNFNTSSVIYMEYMLYGCTNLKSLDLNNH